MERFSKLFEVFKASGKELFFVGGCVRDRMLGRNPKDFDFATSARPGETKEILEKAGFKQWPIGEKFGTIATSVGNEDVEITTYRRDLTPGRHPDVAFSTTLKEDLGRRDFTINSMAMSADGRIVDPFSGAQDLTNRVIRCTGKATERFGEDPLRILRAARFAAKLGFSMDPGTEEAMSLMAISVLGVSKERWFEEMSKLLISDNPLAGIDILASTGVLWVIVPELWAVRVSPMVLKGPEKDLWYHIRTVVKQSPARLNVRWAALLHDIGKPQTYSKIGGEVHFLQHEVLGAEMVECICRRLKMSNTLRKSIRSLVFLHQRVSAVFTRERRSDGSRGSIFTSDKALRRLVRECDDRGCSIEDLLDLFGADCSSAQPRVRDSIAEQKKAGLQALERIAEEDMRPKLPKGIGESIMTRFDLKPGPEVGRLRGILEAKLMDGELDPNTTIPDMIALLEGME